MKHCLLTRKEERYEVTEKLANKIETLLVRSIHLQQETFFGAYGRERMRNYIFDVPRAKDMRYYQRENYKRARIRHYYTKQNSSIGYGEWRIKQGERVEKKRKALIDFKAICDFYISVDRAGLVPVCVLDYERTAFNNTKDSIRITIDRDISYKDVQMDRDLTHHFFKQGKYKPAIIKVKSLIALPKELKDIFAKLPKRQMTKVRK